MKNKYKYPLASSTWKHEEINAINKVIKSDKYTMGENVKKFEKEFAKYLRVKHCIMTNSGSSANLLMIASLFLIKNKKFKLKMGDEVIVPSVSWSTSYYPLLQYNLKVKFVDINARNLNISLSKLEKNITKKTKLVFLVNLGGNCNDYDKIRKILNKRNIYFIEDNCESLGAIYKNKKTGTFGLMGSFSFYFSHHISTMEGGMIATNNSKINDILLSIRAHGWTRNLNKKNSLSKIDNNDFHNSFNFILPGYNLRPLEFSGAVGLEQLKKLNGFVKTRRSNAKKFLKIIKKNYIFLTQDEIGKSSWFWFTFIIKKNINIKRDKIISLFKEYGFETRPIASGNFTKNKVIKYFNYEIPDRLINSDYIHKNGFVIGNNPVNMDKAFIALEQIINKLNKMIK